MEKCSKCGNMVEVSSLKNIPINKPIMCNSCRAKLPGQQSKEKIKTIDTIVAKYFKGKDNLFKLEICRCCDKKIINMLERNLEKKSFLSHIFADSLTDNYIKEKKGIEIVRNYFNQEIAELEKMWESDTDMLLDTRRSQKNQLQFLADLEKIFKIIQRKGFFTSYIEILAIFETHIKNEDDALVENLAKPILLIIENELEGNDLNLRNIIMKVVNSLGTSPMVLEVTTKILEKYNIKSSNSEIESLIDDIREEQELDEFETNMGKSKEQALPNYQDLNGYDFEKYLQGIFDFLGYIVIQTPLSNDQGADLIISKDNEKIVVQAKKYNNSVTNTAIQEAVASIKHYGADRAMVVTNSTFTKSAIELAASNNVELWDGLKLDSIISDIGATPKETYGLYTLKHDEGPKLIEIQCPSCENKFEHPATVSSLESLDGSTITCPNCAKEIEVQMKYQETTKWSCEYCGTLFQTEAEALEHEITCEEIPESDVEI